MDDLVQDFLSETTELLEDLAGDVIAWEKNPADGERLDAIFRCVHTIKGSSGFLNLPRIAKLAHTAEDALDSVRAGKLDISSGLVSAVLRVVDRISETTARVALDGHEPPGDDDDLIAAVAMASASAIRRGQRSVGSDNRDSAPIERKIRVPLDLVDKLMNSMSDMVLARNEVYRQLDGSGLDAEATAAFERLTERIAETRLMVSQMRMQEIDRLFSPLPRSVRDLGERLGKKVNLVIEGGDVEIDREMIEVLRDPLMHVVRNALDHGIETPDERVLAGKPPVAQLCVSARQTGNQIVIELRDDGRGISMDGLLNRAIERGLIMPGDVGRMSDKEKLRLIFRPGFSTASKVTDVSGRGVGMDVVRANIERVGGVVELENRPGKGLIVQMRVPMTLSIVSALTIVAGNEKFALSRMNVVEILLESNENIRIDRAGGADLIYLRGERLAVVTLSELLALPPRPANDDPDDAPTLVIVRPISGKSYALRVDDALDQEELVVRPAPPLVMATGFYAGTTLPDNGRPMLMLDPSGIAARAAIFEEEDMAPADAPGGDDDMARTPTQDIMLLNEFDGATRGLAVAFIERVDDMNLADLQYVGGKWRAPLDNDLIPLFPGEWSGHSGIVKILRMNDGSSTVGYLAADVVDIVSAPVEMIPPPVDGLIAGISVVGDRHVEMLDAHWIFSEADPVIGSIAEKRPVCRLHFDNRDWAIRFLQPIVESAGYIIAYDDDPSLSSPPALTIVPQDAPLVDAGPGAIIRLRNDAIRQNDDEDSIYRYDRTAIMIALRRARGDAR